jgi:hypothetical protein
MFITKRSCHCKNSNFHQLYLRQFHDSYITETNVFSTVYIIAAILLLQCTVHVLLFSHDKGFLLITIIN